MEQAFGPEANPSKYAVSTGSHVVLKPIVIKPQQGSLYQIAHEVRVASL
jgi:hypothetical protein